MKIFDSTLSAIEKKLDLSVRRHALLSSNIANEETPNYIASDYSFSSEVEKALGSDTKELKMTNGKHLDLTSTASAYVYKDKSMPVGADGNNVDLDIEMGKLSDNNRDYNGSLNLLIAKLKMIKSAVSGGRGGF